MENQEKVVSGKWLGRDLTIKTGKFAKQADAAVTVQYGETVVLATVVEAKEAREGIDFFPLMVEFEEKLYAAGIIKGSRWVKREGRATDVAVLSGRMIDRAIRPLFAKESKKDVQVICTILSVDGENDHDIVSLIAASAALAISGLKWAGPISGIRVGLINNEFVYNPSYEQQALSDLDLIVSGTEKKIIMIEAGAKQIKEEVMLQALMNGLKEMQPALDLIKQLQQTVGVKTKAEKIKKITAEEKATKEAKDKLLEIGKAWLNDNIKKFLFDKDYYTKGERKAAISAIKENLDEFLFGQNVEKNDRKFVISELVEDMAEAEVTRAILEDKKRVDGRSLTEIRNLSAEVGILPRNHGAGLFSRGETQVLSVVTLASPGMEQYLEGLEGVSRKRYMHHYNFPPYSVGEASPLRGTGRREIGHGALAEKALMAVVPDKTEFPYTIRVVSETLGSNGSSSMASTCGSTLALMDAGVPIKKHVAGIAMGLASSDDMSKWEILTDIQDLEDGEGGMDFKITGTDEGLTAIQLDTKTIGLSEEMIAKTFSQGRVALNQILEVLKKALPEPRPDLSKYAPKIVSFMIKPEKIGAVIGSGGKNINKLIEEFGVTIDIEDDGLVSICGTDAEMCSLAKATIENMVREYAVGEIVSGKITRILDFGAFLDLGGGNEGLIRVADMAPYYIGRPADFVDPGQELTAQIKEIDDQGRINLSLKGLSENESLWVGEKGKSEPSFGGGRSFGDRPSRRPMNNRFGGGGGGRGR